MVLSSFKRSTRRLMALLLVLPATVLVLGMLYMLGISTSNTPHTFCRACDGRRRRLPPPATAVTISGTTPVMALFVILGQFLGQFLVFLIFPIFFLPYFEEQFEVQLQQVLHRCRAW